MWTRYKLLLNHIKMFGCDSYVHVPSKLRKSLDSKTKVCKLLGYSENVKGYKLYDTQSKKVVMRKDVVFNEFQTNFKSQHKKSRSRLSYNLQWRIKSSTLQCKPPSITTYFNPKSYPTTKCCTTNNSSTRCWQCKQWKHYKKIWKKISIITWIISYFLMLII